MCCRGTEPGTIHDLAIQSKRDGVGLAILGEGSLSYVRFTDSGLSSTLTLSIPEIRAERMSANGDRFVGYIPRHLAVFDLFGNTIWETHHWDNRDYHEYNTFALSAYSRMIACQNIHGLFVTVMTTDETRKVVREELSLEEGGGPGFSLGWSVDSREIVFEQDRQIKLYHLATGKVETIGPGRDPTWSRDGKTISFRAVDKRGLLGKGILLDAASHRDSAVPQLKEIVGTIRWSPDSQYILYADLGGNIISQLLTIGSLSQINGRMIVRRVRDGAEAILIDGGESGLPQRYQWAIFHNK